MLIFLILHQYLVSYNVPGYRIFLLKLAIVVKSTAQISFLTSTSHVKSYIHLSQFTSFHYPQKYYT